MNAVTGEPWALQGRYDPFELFTNTDFLSSFLHQQAIHPSQVEIIQATFLPTHQGFH